MSKPRGTYNPKPITGDPADRFGFPALVDAFLADRAVVGYSHETIKADRVYLGKLAAWLAGEGVTHPGDVTAEMMEQFQQFLHDYRKPDGRPLLLAKRLHGRAARGPCGDLPRLSGE